MDYLSSHDDFNLHDKVSDDHGAGYPEPNRLKPSGNRNRSRQVLNRPEPRNRRKKVAETVKPPEPDQ